MGFEAGASEIWIRFGIFAAVLVGVAALERVIPRRRRTEAIGRRSATNLLIAGIDSIVVRLMALLALPLAGTAAAVFASTHGIGLLNWLGLPEWINIVVTIVVLDFAIWLQHVATHKFPMLWQFHQVHHADVEIDVTTAIRFHPVEMALSVLWKIVCVLVLGAPVAAVVLFEILLNASAMFSHANIALTPAVDAVLRRLIVTPDMHRVHHSVLRREQDSNYGFNLAVWDRVFGTYRSQPENSYENMKIGLKPYQSNAPTRLGWSLMLPFQRLPKD